MNPYPPDDQKRLAALEALHVLDTPREPIFDRLTQLAAAICNTPIATISLIDKDRQWFKSAVGLDIAETARAISFCSHTIQRAQTSVVADTYRSRLFRDNPLVTAPPFLRFYAGIPLVTREGHAVGTLTVMDRRPRRLNRAKLDALRLLAEHVMTELELRRQRILAEALHSRLARQAEHLIEAQRIARLGSWELDVRSRTLRLSEETYRIFGLAPRQDMEEFDAFLASVHAADREQLVDAVESAMRGDQPLDVVHRIVIPGGETRHVHERGQLLSRPGGDVALAGTVQDITGQRKAQYELELLHTSIARVGDIVMITEAAPLDEPGPRIVFANRAFEQRTGYKLSEVLGKSPRLLQGPETQRAELDKVRRALRRKEAVSVELINYSKSGEKFWMEIDIAPVAATGAAISHFVSIQRDITQRKAAEAEIERLAFYDPLTRLPNRRLLLDRLHHALQTADRKANCGALMYLDLDNFKSLNDTSGHDIGDRLLVQVARRLENAVRKSNTIARLGGDEFVVLLEDLDGDVEEAAAQAEIVAEKVLSTFAAPFRLGKYEHYCSTSIGVTLFCSQYDPDEVLKRADVAMYQAKSAGKNAIRFFDQDMQAVVNTRVALDREFRESLHRQEFVLHYQPQADDTGRLVGMEALVRWLHPKRGMLFPSEFISWAEESGLIVRLGRWVLEAACAQIAAWEKQSAGKVPRVAVNVSARQFHHPDFLSQTLTVVEQSGINPDNLKLELTESTLIEHFEDTIEKMAELRRRGIRFSLDDFGTGYSSLSYLNKLPLDEIKIDQAFVRHVLTNPGDAAITQTIVSLCEILGFSVVAEGVETEEQRTFLAEHGCHTFQGYLIGRPLPATYL
ncbi:MAG TPA: EAL domain-containing protein [Noviherbaspirillum sp.]|uniref:sensor domain-containing phosphodiesterase n=1 Tax=Noviherbaspirillum sp. TaxID=1926288 RepID=UPI002D644969|nr:EAL domain-containing protein [Noviherbaspirillum sp.]HYD95279.1 EAL domain-containing protein [Noviherbaspirillum sp.]